ncbi:MAG: DNA polymerase I [Acidobacteriaceae bacterium]
MEYKQKLLMIDGHALTHRAFHALPNLSNSEGFPTGAVFGFFSMFLKALQDIKPTHALVAFDLPGPTFRHKLATDYKATRKATADELTMQLPVIQEILTALNIPVIVKEGYEADDLLGIISRLTPKMMLNIVVTGDLDLLQLINKNTQVFRFRTGFSDYTIYDEKKMVEEYDLRPDQWVDYKALRGDSSDNIPGVRGIGPKTAQELISTFGDLNKVFEAADANDKRIKTGALNKLKLGKASAFLSKQLSYINCKDGLDFDFTKARLADYDREKVISLFQKYAIRSLIDKLPKISEEAKQAIEAKAEVSEFVIVDTIEKLESLIKELSGKQSFAIDTSKTLGPLVEAQMVGLSVAFDDDRAFYLPIAQFKDIDYLGKLKTLLESKTINKIGHDLKTDSLLLKKYGINLCPLSFDTKIAAYLTNPGQRNYDQEALGFSELGFRKKPIEEYLGKPKDKLPFEKLKLEEQAVYSSEDVNITWRLKNKLETQLKAQKLDKLFFEIEMPLIGVLMLMEERGIKLDSPWLKQLGKDADKEIKELEKKIHAFAGEEFNISSPIQLREILFEKLNIPTGDLKRRGKNGELSTAAYELEKLRGQHPIVELIFDYRELSKLKSTYLDSLPELMSKTDGRVHTNYNQTIAATGRLSSSDPNLQNIPVRTELGRQVRKAFVAEKGFVLAALDYSQIELRIAASLSGDPEMVKIFKSGKDFHAATAARLFNVLESAVTYEQRRRAKTINFSVLYGVSAFGLSERSEMGRAEAGEFIQRYYQVFGQLKKFIDGQIAEVRDKGFAINALGRIRQFPEISSGNFSVRNAAERAAFNMPIQSLAADIIKMAMIEIDKKLVSDDCRMLLQVHDELVFEIKKDRLSEFAPKIKQIMEETYKLNVPMVVDCKVGSNWLETEKQ